MGLNKLLRKVKAVAVQPVAVGILRATAHSAKQAHWERFQAFAAKVRGLTTDCKYILPCPHAQVGEQICATVGCRGVDYTPGVIKDILLLGIYDQDVGREVLGDSAVEDKSVNELVRFVESKEAVERCSTRRQTGSDHSSFYLFVQEIFPPKQQQPTKAATTAATRLPAKPRAPQEAPLQMGSGLLRLCRTPAWLHQSNPI